MQDRDAAVVDDMDLKVVPSASDPGGAFRPPLRLPRGEHVKSKRIVYARGGATVGIGAGQMSRVDSSRIAAGSARGREGGGPPESLAKGAVVASDAFFPFADGCWRRRRQARRP